jgi:hypothetical protein
MCASTLVHDTFCSCCDYDTFYFHALLMKCLTFFWNSVIPMINQPGLGAAAVGEAGAASESPRSGAGYGSSACHDAGGGTTIPSSAPSGSTTTRSATPRTSTVALMQTSPSGSRPRGTSCWTSLCRDAHACTWIFLPPITARHSKLV